MKVEGTAQKGMAIGTVFRPVDQGLRQIYQKRVTIGLVKLTAVVYKTNLLLYRKLYTTPIVQGA